MIFSEKAVIAVKEAYETAVTDAKTRAASIIANTGSADDEGVVVILNAMIGLQLSPGHHKIEMTYSPPGFKTGVILLLLGIAIVIYFWYNDRKTNPALIAKAEAKANWKKGIYLTVTENEDAEEKKPVKIIKSKGAVTPKDKPVEVEEDNEAEQEYELDEEALDEEVSEEAEAADEAEEAEEVTKDSDSNKKAEAKKAEPKKNNSKGKNKKK